MINKTHRPAVTLLRSKLGAKTLKEGTFTRWGSRDSSSPLFPKEVPAVFFNPPNDFSTRKEPAGTARREINESLDNLKRLFQWELDRLLNRHGVKEIRRHANVSRSLNCGCNICFTCYCLAWIKDFDQKAQELQEEILDEIKEEERLEMARHSVSPETRETVNQKLYRQGRLANGNDVI